MPAKSKKQERYIRMQARLGKKWAIKWLEENKGQKTKNLPERVPNAHKRRKKRRAKAKS